MMTDPIADMLTRIRNANERKHNDVTMPHSKIKESIANILKGEGFIESVQIKKQDNNKKELNITLKYKGNQRVIQGIKRISKPGLRIYSNWQEIPIVLNGLGTSLVSTSKGIMTGKTAKKERIGGEVLLFIW